jgi:hypothetical protein
MPVRPVVWVPFEQARTYPHMAKHDARIWERFITAYTGLFDKASYDIALGGTQIRDPNATAAERFMWQQNTAKRIDAVVRSQDEIWLCEVRPHAGLDAVGAVLGYTYLSELDKWNDLPLIPTLVTDRCDQDIRNVCTGFDIQLIELPETDLHDPAQGALL